MEKTKYSQDFKDILMPLGMVFGCTLGVILGMFLKPSFLILTVSLGTGVGFLIGLVAYVVYIKKTTD